MLGILSFEQIRLVSEFCRDVISQNKHVMFVCALNKNGRVIDMEKKDDSVLSTLSKHESEIVFMQRILQASMMKDLDEKLGKLRFATIEREYFTEYLFPFHDGAILVFFDSADTRDFAVEISSLIKKLDEKIKSPRLVC
jgi:hypothetical protein